MEQHELTRLINVAAQDLLWIPQHRVLLCSNYRGTNIWAIRLSNLFEVEETFPLIEGLSSPGGMAIIEDEVAICDRGNRSIIFDKLSDLTYSRTLKLALKPIDISGSQDGIFVTAYNDYGDGPYLVPSLFELKSDGSLILVRNPLTRIGINRIEGEWYEDGHSIFNLKRGTHIGRFGRVDPPVGTVAQLTFFAPLSIKPYVNDSLLVTDFGEGCVVQVIGDTYVEHGQFNQPVAIDVDLTTSFIFVADRVAGQGDPNNFDTRISILKP